MNKPSFPLRQVGQPWPGTDTRGGRIDDGRGQLTDRSKNCMINESDILAKRKGFIRGLDEYFGGPVCGLFKYTDECGIEWLLVASEDGIVIRQPYAVPVFEVSDAYPFDAFQGDGPVDVNKWRNTLSYQRTAGQLQVVLGDTPDPLVWFKQAAASSYEVRIQFQFDEDSTQEQEVVVIIKAAGSTATGARLEAVLTRQADSSSLTIQVSHYDAALDQTILFSDAAGTAATGFLKLSYDQEARRVSVEFLEGGIQQTFDPISGVQDADLGRYSALQIAGDTSSAGIMVVDGGPL